MTGDNDYLLEIGRLLQNTAHDDHERNAVEGLVRADTQLVFPAVPADSHGEP